MYMERIESGQGLVEYALIILLIALVLIGIMGVIGTQLIDVFSQVSSSFP
jgi:pilus assembly protein Flp/PilA